MAQQRSNGGKRNARAIGIGAGIAALAAGAAAAYFLYGPNGAKNRKKVKTWMVQARADVLSRMEKLKEVNREAYDNIVETVAKQYQAAKKLDTKDVAQFTRELKNYWHDIQRQMDPGRQAKRPSRTKRTKSSKSPS
jgi:hypothetical protein